MYKYSNMPKKEVTLKNNQKNLWKFLKYFKPVIGLFLIDSLFACVIAGVSVGTPFLTQYIIHVAIAKEWKYLFIGIGLLTTILFVRLISNFVVTRWGHFMGIKMEVNMRNDAIRKLHLLPMKNFDKNDTGTYISRVVTDLKDIPEFAHHAPEDFIIATIVSVGGFVYAFIQSWIIGVVLLVIFILGVIIIYQIRNRLRNIWKRIRENNSKMSASVGFQVEGVSEIKSFNSEKFEYKRFNIFQNKYKKSFFKFYNFEAFFTVINIFIIATTSFITLAIGAVLLAHGSIQVAQLIGLTAAAAILNQPIQKFVNVYSMFSRGVSSVDRFFEFMAQEEEENKGTKIAPHFKGLIHFQNVDFSYLDIHGKKVYVLKKFNLKIKPGEKIAIVGQTGIGKTTILKLLSRFYKINSGKILIDNQNIEDFDIGSLRQRIGYVQQNVTLFHETIKNNILYGNASASFEEIKKAARYAEIHNFIVNLPNGYESISGPRGTKLSGGQKQRISLARTFLSHSDVICMDEATSSLDTKTEIKIQKAIDTLSKDKTTIIVAHRLSTIKKVDKIYVLGKYGVILESGNHKKLLKNKSHYFQMNF